MATLPRVSERSEQAAGIKLLRALGAEVYIIGTVRPKPNPGCPTCLRNQSTRQTPGLADVQAFLRVNGSMERVLLMWEVKRPKGAVRPEQIYYRQLCGMSGVAHVMGDSTALEKWLREQGFLR